MKSEPRSQPNRQILQPLCISCDSTTRGGPNRGIADAKARQTSTRSAQPAELASAAAIQGLCAVRASRCYSREHVGNADGVIVSKSPVMSHEIDVRAGESASQTRINDKCQQRHAMAPGADMANNEHTSTVLDRSAACIDRRRTLREMQSVCVSRTESRGGFVSDSHAASKGGRIAMSHCQQAQASAIR